MIRPRFRRVSRHRAEDPLQTTRHLGESSRRSVRTAGERSATDPMDPPGCREETRTGDRIRGILDDEGYRGDVQRPDCLHVRGGRRRSV